MTATEEPNWLPLLRRLTTVVPAWSVWKNAASAFDLHRDVDSVAPRHTWPTIVDEFRRWARDSDLGPVVVCGHAPGSLVLAACASAAPTRLLELDVYERAAGLVPAETLVPVMELDANGFRRLRAGAEGLLLLLLLARRGGRPPRRAADLENVGGLLRSDLVGAESTSRIIGVLGRPALAAAVPVAEGRWNRRAMLLLELAYAARALRDPRQRAAWLEFKLRRAGHCPVLRAVAGGRVVRGDLDEWLAAVAASHPVPGLHAASCSSAR